VHHHPALYPDPHAFRPERFLEHSPGTYTFLPFGGGRRRCLGSSFAMLESVLVLRSIVASCEVGPGRTGGEIARRRNITVRPGAGASTVLTARREAGVAVA